MNGKKSSKHNSGNSYQAIKSTVTNTLCVSDSYVGASSNTYDDGSTSPTRNLSSVSQKPNFEGITLIWCDTQISQNEDTNQTLDELREINDCVILYSDQVSCVTYIQSVENEKIFLITSGKTARSIIPEIHKLKQVDSIFIFCLKVENYQDMLPKYDSLVGIYCQRSDLIDSIKENVEFLQKQLNTFSFYKEHGEKVTRDISKESAEFLWFQLFKDILLQMPRNKQAKQELIDFSRQYYRGNKKEYENIREFEQSYQLDKSIYWYTKDSFLYRLVNKALRTEDVGQLHTFRFFIRDLSTKLAQIHTQTNYEQKTIIRLYRGLKLESNELERLKTNLGCIISANGFLSTSHSKDVAIEFATQSTKRTNIVPVLYEIKCNLNASQSVIFADITEDSKFATEEEVLFDIGSTFKIESIRENEELKMVVVKLTATDAGRKMAKKYIRLNRKRNEETTPNVLFGILLIQMGKYDQSLNYFNNLLNTSSKETVDKFRVYSAMGLAYLCKDDLDEAYKIADRAYRNILKIKPSRIKDSTRPMTIIAHVYLRREMYEESLDFYFEVLDIREKFYSRNHLDTALILNDMGNVFYKMQDYEKSLMYYEKSFEIRKTQLPPVHLDIAASLNNLGLIAWKTNKGSSAINYYRQSLDIRKELLPLEHNDIAQCLYNIAHVFYERGDINQSLEYFTEALTNQKIDFDSSDRGNLLTRLEEKFGPRPDYKTRPFIEYAAEHAICKIERFPEGRWTHGTMILNSCCLETNSTSEEIKGVELQKQEHLTILKNFIKTLAKGGNYRTELAAVQKMLKESESFIAEYGHDHYEYLLSYLRKLVKRAYDSNDKSIEAFRFYDKVQFIMNSSFPHLTVTADIVTICIKRIEWKKQEDLSILEDLIKTFRNNDDYSMAMEAVREIVIPSSQTFISGYDHSEFLTRRLRKLVKRAYESNDKSIDAFRFYDKVQFVMNSALSDWTGTTAIETICIKRIEWKKKEDVSILENLIETLRNNDEYSMAMEAVREIVIPSSQIFISGYDHSEFLMTHLRDLVIDAYDSTDESITALRFFEKLQLILQNTISPYANTNDIQIICLDRIGRINQLNNNYQSAVESLEHSMKIQKDNRESADDFPDKLSNIGLLHMTLGNYESALMTFNDALELLQPNYVGKEREMKLLLKRIGQAKYGLN